MQDCFKSSWAEHKRLHKKTSEWFCDQLQRATYEVRVQSWVRHVRNKTKEIGDSVSVTFVVDTNSANTTDPTLYTYLVLRATERTRFFSFIVFLEVERKYLVWSCVMFSPLVSQGHSRKKAHQYRIGHWGQTSKLTTK